MDWRLYIAASGATVVAKEFLDLGRVGEGVLLHFMSQLEHNDPRITFVGEDQLIQIAWVLYESLSYGVVFATDRAKNHIVLHVCRSDRYPPIVRARGVAVARSRWEDWIERHG
ncbi:hypothetical protein [Nonomuraea sp. NPDC049141]|uniref:hypothetical protein n=1 Tax=unclassified Nonomuraea TaxID=2593643 RepID=UPI0033F127D9